MNQRFILFLRSGVFYCEDKETRKQTSLRTRSRAEAITLLHAKNESARQPVLNLQMARVYLSASDPQVATRTWQTVMDEIIRTKTDANQARWITCAKSKQFDIIRSRTLIETQAEPRSPPPRLPLHSDNQVSSLRGTHWCDQSSVEFSAKRRAPNPTPRASQQAAGGFEDAMQFHQTRRHHRQTRHHWRILQERVQRLHHFHDGGVFAISEGLSAADLPQSHIPIPLSHA